MEKPLMLQEADDARIESLEKRLHARTKIEVARSALDRLERRCRACGTDNQVTQSGRGCSTRESHCIARLPLERSPALTRSSIRGQAAFYFDRAGVAASIIQNVEFSRHLQHQPRQAMFHHFGKLVSPLC